MKSAPYKCSRDKLRCKEIWVSGANRYRNPDEDLPVDFEERREENYKALKQPLDAESFIAALKQEMIQWLEKLNEGMPKNSKVRITDKGKGLDLGFSVRTTSRAG